MELLKKHYEKILLGIVLLALAGTAFWLFTAIEEKRKDVEVSIPPLGGKKVTPVELAPYQKTLEAAKQSAQLDLGNPHHLVNPATWKQRSDGALFKITTEDTPVLVKTTPLHFIIGFERVAGSGYYFGITREAAPRVTDQKKAQSYLSEGDKNNFFVLKKVQGGPEAPSGFVLELLENKKEVTVTPSEPYRRVDGFAADLRYEPENRNFNNVRAGGAVSFGGERYKVIAITENEVTVQAESNQKQIRIKQRSAP